MRYKWFLNQQKAYISTRNSLWNIQPEMSVIYYRLYRAKIHRADTYIKSREIRKSPEQLGLETWYFTHWKLLKIEISVLKNNFQVGVFLILLKKLNFDILKSVWKVFGVVSLEWSVICRGVILKKDKLSCRFT